MRQIGTIPRELDPGVFTDHLTTLGIRSRVDDRPEGWPVWIYNEDHLPRARQELDEFLKNPADPRYHAATQTAQMIKREAEKVDRQYRRNFRELRGHWDRPNLRGRPVTAALIGASVLVYLLFQFSPYKLAVVQALSFAPLTVGPEGHFSPGLAAIERGQVWRIVTPIFLHFNGMHILFNMWWLAVLGGLIEKRRGPQILAALVLLAAVASNVGEFAYELQFHGGPRLFGGMSGVVYALFGYVWMKGNHEPEQGMILHPSSVQMMLIWLVLCFTGTVGPVANAAHVVGLIVGVLFGLARF